MKIIGLNGRAHSGKDTAVRYITEAAMPAHVERAGFADKMKLSGIRALGWSNANPLPLEVADYIKENCHVQVVVDGYGAVLKSIPGREFWQRYGTEAHRDVYGVDFHVDALLPSDPFETVACFPGVDILAVTDTRFPNEAERILALGGVVWHIDADERLGPLPPDAHISEHPLPAHLTTAVVPNNGTLEQYEIAVKAAYALSTGGVSC